MRILRALLLFMAILFVAHLAAKRYVGRVDAGQNLVVNTGTLPEVSDRASKLHESLLVADLHGDSLLWPRDLLHRQAHGHIDLPRLLEGNVGLQVFSAVTKTPSNLNYESNTDYTDDIRILAMASGWPIPAWRKLVARGVYQAEKLHDLEAEAGGQLVIIRSRADLDALLAARMEGEKRIGALLALEGAHALEGELDNLDQLFEAGYRMMGLAHFFDNEVSGSAHGLRKRGLTPFGVKAVARAQELGMTIDLSHASAKAIKQVLRDTQKPVVFSHSGVRATCEQSGRNLDDDTLGRLRRTQSVVGIGLWSQAICGESLDKFFDAIDHAVEVAGINHVGLGTDFDGYVSTPIDASQWAHVTAGLLERGYRAEQIRKLMGGNVIRVLQENLPEQ